MRGKNVPQAAPGFLCGFARHRSTLHAHTHCTQLDVDRILKGPGTTLKIKTEKRGRNVHIHVSTQPHTSSSGLSLTTVPHWASQHSCLVAGYFLQTLGSPAFSWKVLLVTNRIIPMSFKANHGRQNNSFPNMSTSQPLGPVMLPCLAKGTLKI